MRISKSIFLFFVFVTCLIFYVIRYLVKSEVNRLVRENTLQDVVVTGKLSTNIVRKKNNLLRSKKPFVNGKRVLVSGGAGFVGSHLVDKLLQDGYDVIVVDNFFTGRKRNLQKWLGHSNLEIITHDVINPIYLEVDEIYHLASPASPPHYMYNPIKTIKCNTIGTMNLLGLAKRVGARFLFASTSEVYGNPSVHPQPETYFGNVNPVGPRACYDEGKRAGEALCYAYSQTGQTDVRIARIFNTFGPRMHIDDGRAISNLITQAILGKPMTLYGDGSVTRSFQYITDLVDGLYKLMKSNISTPVNIGNPEEYSIKNMSQIIKKLTRSNSSIVYMSPVPDDPQRRKPNISKAMHYLNWKPLVSVVDGLKLTIDHFKKELRAQEAWKPFKDFS